MVQYLTKYLCIEPPPGGSSRWAHTLILHRLDCAEITRRAGEARAEEEEGLWFILFFFPNHPTGLITRYVCRRSHFCRSFINIVDCRHSPDEPWMSVLLLLFIIDSFCRSDLASLRLAPSCQSAGWCARRRPLVRAHWRRRLKVDEAAFRTVGPKGSACCGVIIGKV